MKVLVASLDHLPCARGGETVFSPERTSGLRLAAAKEGVREGTMGSPTVKT